MFGKPNHQAFQQNTPKTKAQTAAPNLMAAALIAGTGLWFLMLSGEAQAWSPALQMVLERAEEEARQQFFAQAANLTLVTTLFGAAVIGLAIFWRNVHRKIKSAVRVETSGFWESGS